MKDFPDKDRSEFFSSKLDWPWNRKVPTQADLEAMKKPNWLIQKPEKPKPIVQKTPEKISKVELKMPAYSDYGETISSSVIEFSAPKEKKVDEAPKDFEDPPKEYFAGKIENNSNLNTANPEINSESQKTSQKIEQIYDCKSDVIEKIISNLINRFKTIESKIEEERKESHQKESDYSVECSKNLEKQQQLLEPLQIFQSGAENPPMTLVQFESLATTRKEELNNHWLGVRILRTNFSFSIMLTKANFVQIRIADLENKINLSKKYQIATFQAEINRKTLTIRQLVSVANSEWQNSIFKIEFDDWIHIAASDFVGIRFFL